MLQEHGVGSMWEIVLFTCRETRRCSVTAYTDAEHKAEAVLPDT